MKGLGWGGEYRTSDSQGVTRVTRLPSEEVKAGNLIKRLVSRGEESRGKPNTCCLRSLGISLEEHKYFLLFAD